MDNTKELPRVLSLCTGYGGLEKGIERAIGKVRVLAHVEIEAFAVANLVDKMETGQMVPAPIWTDLKTFNAKIFRGQVDILTGGYPCQPFSAAGKRDGTDDPRHLWPYIRNIISDCQPRRVFFENVEGHLSMGILSVLSELESMGYDAEVGIFSAAEVGAPHQRKRVFILAKSEHDRRGPITTTTEERKAELRKAGTPGRIEKRESEVRPEGLSCDELAESKSPELKQPSDTRGRRTGPTDNGGNVPNALSNGSGESDRNHESRFTYENGKKWPARPGQAQHDWEEPRTVVDA